MGVLRIRLFGTVQTFHEGRAPGVRPIHAVQALLAYLVLHRKRLHAREALAGLFWAEHSDVRARSCLSTALWRLRQVLEPAGVPRGTYLLTPGSGEVGFNGASEHWLDVATFEEGLQPVLRSQGEPPAGATWAGVESAVAHYTADLLEGFYDEWALRERERLRLLYLDGLGCLLGHYSASGAVEPALACGRRILDLDPLREEIHREIMRLHLRRGHRALALQQYAACREVLEAELGVAPMEETQALCHEIVPEETHARVTASTPLAQRVLPPLRIAAQSLDDARDQLSQAIRLAERTSEDPMR